jgi:hypothetical protein
MSPYPRPATRTCLAHPALHELGANQMQETLLVILQTPLRLIKKEVVKAIVLNRNKRLSPQELPAEILSKKSRSKRKPVRLPLSFQPKFWEENDCRIAAVPAIKARCLKLIEDADRIRSYQRDLLCQRVWS